MENPDGKLADMQPTVDDCSRFIDRVLMDLSEVIMSAERAGKEDVVEALRAVQTRAFNARTRLGA
jgi:hypothetical protein